MTLAQGQTWTAQVRGSWVQTGALAAGDVNLNNSQIVVADNENTAVHQAAEFLAGDIEKISGHRPPIIKAAAAGKVNIRLVTQSNGEWESYRIFTRGQDVWLIGSNPRGTAFAAYTLSERLGIDPIYIWTGYRPDHHDPLILKRTTFSQGPPRSVTAASSMTTRICSRVPSTPTAIRCKPATFRWNGTNAFSRRRSVCG